MSLQVTEKRSGYLELRSGRGRNRLWAWFGGLLVVGGGLMALQSIVGEATYREVLECARTGDAGQCTVRSGGVLLGGETSSPIDQIASVQVQRENEPPEVLLLSRGENLRFRVSGDGTSAGSVADRIEAFLADETAPELRLERDYTPSYVGPVFGLIMFVGSGLTFWLWFINWTTIRFTDERFEFEREWLVGRRDAEYPLEEIEDIVVETKKHPYERGFDMRHRVVVSTSDGESFPLTTYYTSDRGTVEQSRDEIATFVEKISGV